MAKLHAAISSAIRGANIEDLTRHPEDKWSAAEILEHLNLTYVGTIKNLERRLKEGKPTTSARTAKFWQRMTVTRLGFFPPGRKSPERVAPRGTPVTHVVAEILDNLTRMDSVISHCESHFSARTPIADHPALGPLTAAEWRGFHLTHGLHHVKQIRARTKTFLLDN